MTNQETKESYIKSLENSCLNEYYFKLNYNEAVKDQLIKYRSGESVLTIAEEFLRISASALFKLGQPIYQTVENYNLRILPESSAIFITKINKLVDYLFKFSDNEQATLQSIFNESYAFIQNHQKSATEDFANAFKSVRTAGTGPCPQNIKKDSAKAENFAKLYGKGKTYVFKFVNCDLIFDNVDKAYIDKDSGSMLVIGVDGKEAVVNPKWLSYEIK